jgi:predicted phosphodiesterase
MAKQIRPRLSKVEFDLINNYRNGNNVGIIGDTHEPFCHPEYRDFCYEVFNKFGCSTIVNIGDEVDNHAISYHETDPDGHSAGKEADLAQENLNKWYKTFPDVKVCIGNHTALIERQAKTAGMPKKFVKTYEEAWEAPNGWKWALQWEIDNVIYTHGTGSQGQVGAINRAKDNRQSTVIGHIHSFGGVLYSASDKDLIFGLNVGCGIDINAYAMEYGRPFAKRPTLGCGVVLGGKIGCFIPMDMGSKIEYKK